MPLGTEVDLGPGHIVLDGVPAVRRRGTAETPVFGPCLLWPRLPISTTAELLFYTPDALLPPNQQCQSTEGTPTHDMLKNVMNLLVTAEG